MKVIPPKVKGKPKITASGTLPNGSTVVINDNGTVSTVSNNDIFPTASTPGNGVPIPGVGTGTPSFVSSTYDSYNKRVVIVWRDTDDSSGRYIVGEVKGSEIIFGDKLTFNNTAITYTSICFDSNLNKIFIAFTDNGNSDNGYGIAGEVDPSTNTITFGSKVLFRARTISYIATCFCPNVNKIALCYYETDGGSNVAGAAKLVTLAANNSITSYNPDANSGAGFDSAASSYINVAFDSNVNKVVVAYINTSSKGQICVADINNGVSLNWGTTQNISNTNNAIRTNIAFDPDNNFMCITYQDTQDSNKGKISIVNIASGVNNGITGSVVTSTFNDTAVNDQTLTYSPASKSFSIFFHNVNQGSGNITEFKVLTTQKISINTRYIRGISGSGSSKSSFYVPETKQVVSVDNNNASIGIIYYIQKFRIDTLGSPQEFEAGNTQEMSVSYNATAKRIVISYLDNDDSNYGKAIVGTVSADNTISFGTPVKFNGNTASNNTSITSIINKPWVVIAFCDGGNSQVNGVVGIINSSNNSISFGTPNTLSNTPTATQTIGICPYNVDTQGNSDLLGVIVAFDTDYSSGGYSAGGYVSAGIVNNTGTAISFGAAVQFNALDSSFTQVVYASGNDELQNKRPVVFYRDDGNNNYGTARVINVSNPNSISLAAEVLFTTSGNANAISVTSGRRGSPLENSSVMTIAWYDSSVNNAGEFCSGAVGAGGNQVSFVADGTFQGTTDGLVGNNPQTTAIKISHNEAADKTVITYLLETNRFVYKLVSYDSSTQYVDTAINEIAVSSGSLQNAITYDENARKTIIVYRDVNDGFKGKAVVLDVGYANLTSGNYIGISSGGDAPDNAKANVDIVGTINNNQSGLSTGQKHYVQKNGTLSTTADTPSVFAGTALSETKLLVKK